MKNKTTILQILFFGSMIYSYSQDSTFKDNLGNEFRLIENHRYNVYIENKFNGEAQFIDDTSYYFLQYGGSQKQYVENISRFCINSKGKHYLDGLEIVFYIDSQIMRIMQFYKNDSLNGVSKLFYPNGQLNTNAFYTNGKRYGDFISYWNNGNLKTKGHYLNGEKTGKWESYHKNGNRYFCGEYYPFLFTIESNDTIDILRGNNYYPEIFKDFYTIPLKIPSKIGLWQYWNENGELVDTLYFTKENPIPNRKFK